MMDVTFKLNTVDFSDKLSTYEVNVEYEYPVEIQTLDGTEHFVQRKRPTLTFSLIPLTDEEVRILFNCLTNQIITVEYTSPYLERDVTASMRCITNLVNVFGLKSVTGDRYYKQTQITLRQLTVM